MKNIKKLMILSFILGYFVTTAFSQCPSDIKGNPNCPDHQLYEDQAEIRIKEFKTKITDLEAEFQLLTDDVKTWEKNLEDTKSIYKECNDNLYYMIGATPQDVGIFKQKLGIIEGKTKEMQQLPDEVLADKQPDVVALETELNELRKVRISVLPEFYPKIIRLAKDINPGLKREKQSKEYIVKSWFENRDCLWNIAGNTDIYGDPFQWPRIWHANTDIIFNPDIIHPGQSLSIPEGGPITPEEIKAERKYWKEKRQSMEPVSQTTEQGNQGQ